MASVACPPMSQKTYPPYIFEEETPDSWKDFVEHAKAAGALFLTMSEVVLEKSDVSILLEQIRDQNFPDGEALPRSKTPNTSSSM